MVQVLPQVPGFLDRLGSVLNETGQGIQQAGEKKTEKLKSQALMGVLSDPNASPLQKVNAFAQLPEQYKKSTAPVYASVLGPQAQSEADMNAYQNFVGQNPGFDNQFRGAQPQQPSDDQSIRQSTATAPQMQGRQGLSPQVTPTSSPLPSSTSSSEDISPEHEKFLIKQAAFKSSKNPHIAAVGNQAQGELDRLRETRKHSQELQKEDREFERKLQEKEVLPYFEQIAKDADNLSGALQSNQQIIDAIINGDIGPGSLAHFGEIAKDLGIPSSIANLLQSPDTKEFNNGIKQLMGHTIKDTFRGTTTQREIDLAEAMQAEIGVDPNANLAAAWAVQSDLLLRQERLKLHNDYIAEDKPRSKIPAMVNKKLEPYRKQLSDQYFEAISELRKKK